MKSSAHTLTEKDILRLKKVYKYIDNGTACSYDKEECLKYLKAVIIPLCSACRKPLKGDIVVLEGGRKMHESCAKKYLKKQ